MLDVFSRRKITGGSAYWSNTGVCLSTFLCMHKILVHAQHSCACTTLLCMHWRGQGPRPGPKKSAGPGRTPSAFFGSRPWALAAPVHAQECSACTRVLCMHRNLVHAQESYIIILYYYIIILYYHIYNQHCFDLFLKFVRSSGFFSKNTYTHNRLIRIQ